MTTWQETGAEILICQHSPENIDRSRSSAPFRIAAFDLDSTLIKSKSGQLKTDDPDDWTWWHPTVPGRIQQAFDEGFQIVIITSQGRLTLRDGSASSAQALFKTKIESILQALSVPVTLYAACANDNWRKPRTRTWQHFLQRLSQEGEVDEGKSFLVGDAAGRVGDHDAADRHFCENVGIEFFTPEEWFLGAKKEEYIDRFDPKRYLGPNNRPEADLPDFVLNGPAALYLLVGPPGAGKTTFYYSKMKPLGYERVNPNSVGSKDPGESINDLLASNKHVVLDDINLDRSSRSRWISLARGQGVPIFAVYFTAPPELCLHNDAVRALGRPENNWEDRKVYPRIAFRNVVDRFEEPTLEEGFNQVHKVDYEWRGTEEARHIWQKFWI